MIYELLSDGKPHPIEEVHTLHIEVPKLKSLLKSLVQEEEIIIQDGLIRLRKPKGSEDRL